MKPVSAARTVCAGVLMLALATSGDAGELSLYGGNCGWPFRTDPSIVNVLWPDENADYWITALPTLPAGFSYRIRGTFPRARYFSFTAYDGIPIDTVLDTDVAPDAGDNPFVTGNDRTGAAGSYTIPIVADAAGDDAASLYVASGQLGTPSPAPYVIFRLYVPDPGSDRTGDAGVPRLEVVSVAEGDAVALSELDCEVLRNAAAAPFEGVQSGIQQTGAPVRPPVPLVDTPTQPATDPPTWVAQSGIVGRAAALAGREGVDGGPANNPHSVYVVAGVSLAFGEIIAVRAKAPTFADTGGATEMPGGELRYWSFCQNSRTTRYVGCLRDDRFVPDHEDPGFCAGFPSHELCNLAPGEQPDPWVTFVLSTPDRIPANAVNWVPFGPETEGLFFYRQMLPTAGYFPTSAHAVADSPDGDVEGTMGEYFPQLVYCSVAEFEADRCGLVD